MPDDFERFGREVARSFVPLEVERTTDEPFHGEVHAFTVGDVTVAQVTATAHLVRRSERLVLLGGRAYLKISLQQSGPAVLVQDGRQVVLEPGDIAVYDTSRPYSLLFAEPFATAVLMLPPESFGLPAAALAGLTAHRFSSAGGLGTLVIPLIHQLVGSVNGSPDVFAPRLINSVVDLISAMLSDELHGRPELDGGRQGLWLQVWRYIEDNLTDSLSPDSIAAANHISTRYLHALFKANGVTVARSIREARLQRCRRDLLDPLCAHLSVHAIGRRWGFPDAPAFSRAFRAAYGIPPSAARGHRFGAADTSPERPVNDPLSRRPSRHLQ